MLTVAREAREIRIGSLEDISIMMPSEDVNRRIKLGQDAFQVLIDDLDPEALEWYTRSCDMKSN